ncbi:MAG TPA: SNF2-related protein [Ignavibacteriaceae bacterium]|nr:SNF2-related protein [Ignavibacteriaceae bacterium]
MLKQVRKKIASSISNSDEPEQFLWNKWLRAPITEYEIVTSPGVQIYDTENLNEWIAPPSLQQEIFDFSRVRVSKKIEKYFVPKIKTNKIFFGFGETVNQKVKISENNPLKFNVIAKLEQKDADTFLNLKKGDSNETSLKLNPQQKESAFKLKSTKAENIDLPRNKPDAKKPKNLIDEHEMSSAKLHVNEEENLINSKPEIFNIELLKLEDLKKQKSSVKVIQGTFDLINNKTEISKIEVQSPDKLIKSIEYSEKEKNKTVAFDKVKSSPKIYKVKTSGIEKINAPVYYLKDIHPKEVNVINNNADISKYFEEPEKTEVIDPLSVVSKEGTGDLLSSILQPSSGLKEAEKEEILFELFDFQKEGTEFLGKNQHSLIAEEMGTGKTIQAVAAVRILFRQKSIKSALVICPQVDTGNIEATTRTGNPSGWAGHFSMHAPELSLNTVTADETNEKQEKQSLIEKWGSQASVFIIGYSSLIKSINYEIIDKERLKKFDCIVFDEVQNLISKNITNYFSGLEGSKLKYIFGLTSLPFASIKNGIEPLFKTENHQLEIIQRKKSDAGKELPAVIKQDYWLELDANQKIEYSNILSQGREKLAQLVQAGNPFLIQSNVFTLIHQLKQSCNFFSSSETSPKSELLLNQLEIISKTKKKVLIFSQYDKMGTQRLEQVLKKAGISSMVYQTSMPAREMEKIVRNFRTSKDTTALIFGLKAGGLNISLPDVHYIIHYDNWWNPVTLWQVEEKINCLEKDEPLNIYTYLNGDSIDLKINEMLVKRGLLEKNIIENLSPENIYEFFSSEDWLNVFQVPGSSEKEMEERFSKAIGKVEQLTIDDFQNKLKMFFTRLGFKNLVLRNEKNKDVVNISGTFLKNGRENRMEAKCLFSDEGPDKDFEGFLTHKDDKLFIVSLKARQSKPQIKLPGNAAYINQELFLNYLVHFKLI